MKLRLTLDRAGDREPATDIVVTADTTATVGELAEAVARRDPRRRPDLPGDVRLTLRVDGRDRRLVPGALPLDQSGIRSGQAVSVVPESSAYAGAVGVDDAAATLEVVEGPDAGKEFRLRIGANTLGRDRDNDVRLTDELVSKQHARVTVGETVEIADLGSSNGLLLRDEPVQRTVLRDDDVVVVGETSVRVRRAATSAVVSDRAVVGFNRSPRLDVCYAGITITPPDPPQPAGRPRFTLVPVLAPMVLGFVMFLVTGSIVSVLFVALSPVLMVGNVVEGRISGRRAYAAELAAFRDAIAGLRTELAAAVVDEVSTRATEHPATDAVVYEAQRRTPALWSRRPDERGFLEIRIGVGAQPSRSTVELPTRHNAPAEPWQELVALRDDFAVVRDVPLVAVFADCGSLGIAGPRASALGAARSVIAQIAALHSPAEVVLCGVAGPATAADWEWLKWLPHVMSDHSPLAADALAMTPGGAVRLVAGLEELVDARAAASTTGGTVPLPRIVLLVEDEAPVERSRLVELAEAGPACGIHLVWVASAVAQLPAACRTFVEFDPVTGASFAGFVASADRVAIRPEVAEASVVASFGKSLAPVVDVGAKVDDDTDLPQRVSVVAVLGTEVTRSTAHVIDRWRASGSVPGESRADRRRRGEPHLRAAVGTAVGQNFVLDLREQGPHALVGGTTGSGKSEFLQSWIVGLAVEHSPARVTFLFVDYKGGAAFSECERLPHAVGMVTDLTPHLVGRVLDSLSAELRHREEILRRHNAKSLVELERRDDVDAPPSLVIVVDEFAALASEVPGFVDGVVDIAQRGRSLGLHLILATQRPAGVIKGSLRANTNLRIALRMADEEESEDVIGTPQAAYFDALVPGRAVAKVGAGRVTPFQSGYVGGWTSDSPPPPVIRVAELRFGSPVLWEPPEDVAPDPASTGPNDLRRLVDNVIEANARVGLPAPRRPWLDPLPPVLGLRSVAPFESDSSIVFGLRDLPGAQVQEPVAFEPDRDGNMAVYGTGGSGKTTFLRTLAIAAGLGESGGPCHVYALDFGGRGLQSLDGLPHVGAVVNADDHERTARLLRWLREVVDERARRFAAADAASITGYRDQTRSHGEARVLLLVDGVGAFRQAYETGERARWFDVFQGIAAEGRQVGVHVVVSADRGAAIPTSIGSLIQRRLVLRLADDNEYGLLGVPPRALDPKSPPGRGFVDGTEVQVAVLGGTSDAVSQAEEVRKVSERMRSITRLTSPVPVQRLAERVPLATLPAEVEGLPVLGVADDTLCPIGFTPQGPFLVAGPSGSGRTSLLANLVLSLRRTRTNGRFVYLGAGPSRLPALAVWSSVATTCEDVAELATDLAAEMGAAQLEPGDLTVVVENVPEFLNTVADTPLQDLLKACRSRGAFVVADGDSSALGSSWPLLQPWKSARHGVALQPDQTEGDIVFRTPFPRISRAEFPPGRGLYVRAGRAVRVQCALAEEVG